MKVGKRFDKKPLILALGALFSSALLVSTVQADDVDVYIVSPPAPPPANILFVLDESGSMSSGFPGAPAPGTRMAALQNAMLQILTSPNFSNVNAAIMGYTTPVSNVNPPSPGITVHSDFLPLNVPANVNTLTTAVNNLRTLMMTPSVQALDSARQWFTTSFADGNGTTGNSPLNSTLFCSPNSIVFLTDGQPNSNSMTTFNGNSCLDSNVWTQGGGGRCALEIARFEFNTDLFPAAAGQQNIVTHTVSMMPPPSNPAASDPPGDFLRAVAREGHGFPFNCAGLTGAQATACLTDNTNGFYRANNAAALTSALTAIVQNTTSAVSFSYNAPSIPVNPADATSSGNEIYIPMLVPDPNGSSWKGNLKKYNLQRNPSTGEFEIRDANGAIALDSSKQILATAQSEWDVDSSPDGDDPHLGGVVEKMANDYPQISQVIANTGVTDYDDMLNYPGPGDHVIRKIVTYLDNPQFGPKKKKLFAPINRIVPSNDPAECSNNPEIVASMFGPSVTNASCLPMLQWLVTGSYDTGQVDAQGDPIIDYKFGAPIHTTPVVIGSGSTNAHKRIYLPTSDGMLHAFDSAGVEQWAFMPQELMVNLPGLINPTTTTPPTYGLDGNVTVVHNDINHNYQIDSPSEQVLLVFGQRRGGNHYYAIDVTDYNNPKFAYQITGGAGQFAKLGQTWSQPVYTRLDDGSTNGTPVLIFGGGYDTNQDTQAASNSRIADTIGNAIYIVDAFNGNLITTITHANMKNSIPSRISIMDMDSDGLTDRLYAADVGGRIIRVDIDDNNNGAATAKVIADVGASGGVKFFNQPTIAYEGGAGGFLSINVGSGDRSRPTLQSDDSFFMIKDRNVWSAPTGPMITTSDLFQITNSTSLSSYTPTAQDKADLKSKEGWQFKLPTGVKVFSTARVLDYVTIFTTYYQLPNSPATCSAGSGGGNSRVYALNMLTGMGVFKDSTGRVNYQELKMPFIPPSPVLISNAGTPASPALPNGQAAMNDIFVGLESAISFPPKMYQLNWEEVINSN